MAWIHWLRAILWTFLGAFFLIWLVWFLKQNPAVKPDLIAHGNYLTVEGVQLHYLEKGEGKTVILLHGFPMHAESFARIFRYAWEKHRVIALDLPEQGYSGKKGRCYTPDDFALIVKLFLDKLEVKEVDVVGHDLGAGVGLAFAANYPNLTKKLVLISPLCGNLGVDGLGPWWRWPLVGEVWSMLFLNHTWFRAWLKTGWTSPYSAWENVVEQYYQPVSTYEGRKGFLAVLRGCTRVSYASFQERLQVPTLLLFGDNDPYCPAKFVREFQKNTPGILVRGFPKVGHFPQEEAPRQTYEAILGFIGN
jgi:pimeloyl-ACP methyl ester carboxylesterase